jgi:hypothetical protein
MVESTLFPSFFENERRYDSDEEIAHSRQRYVDTKQSNKAHTTCTEFLICSGGSYGSFNREQFTNFPINGSGSFRRVTIQAPMYDAAVPILFDPPPRPLPPPDDQYEPQFYDGT